MKKRRLEYTAFIYPAEEGGFVAEVPALEGCYTQGETIEETKKMIREAIQAYVESLIKHNEPIPHDIKPVEQIIEISVAV